MRERDKVLELRPTQVIEVPKVEPQVDQLPDHSKPSPTTPSIAFEVLTKKAPVACTRFG
jgi:hypothetical protein